jgi:hypothetical protein
MKDLQGTTAFGQTLRPIHHKEEQHGRKSAAAAGSAGHCEIVKGVAPGVEDAGGLKQGPDQKIAACGSSYWRPHSRGGAAAGCDLLSVRTKTPMTITGHRRFHV